MYYQNGKVAAERDYRDGIENGFEMEYYEDGSLKQKGEFVNGKENGIWDMYFPNGQIKQRSHFIDGVMDGESTTYYSTGKILAVEVTKNGKTTPDKGLEKVNQAMNKGHGSYKEGDYKTAIKNYSKAIELDSSYAEAYFSRGTIKLNDFKFDEAIADFDKALRFEPFMAGALSNRAFARIRKYEFGNSRTLSKSKEMTVLASKDPVPVPQAEKEKICSDLQTALFLGTKTKMINEAISTYCQAESGN
jgi:tetratricopeptide (TPR) repeat protein